MLINGDFPFVRYPDIVHVIDLLPNSKIILRDKTLFDNAAELLEKFEESVSFYFRHRVAKNGHFEGTFKHDIIISL